MFRRLNRRTTKTRQKHWESEGHKALGSLKDPVSNLPIQVNDFAIQIKKETRAPRSRPIKDTERTRKLSDTMRLDNILREKI